VVVTDIVYWRYWGLYSKELEVEASEAIPEAHLPNKVELPVAWKYTRYVFQNGGSESTISHRELGNSYLPLFPLTQSGSTIRPLQLLNVKLLVYHVTGRL